METRHRQILYRIGNEARRLAVELMHGEVPVGFVGVEFWRAAPSRGNAVGHVLARAGFGGAALMAWQFSTVQAENSLLEKVFTVLYIYECPERVQELDIELRRRHLAGSSTGPAAKAEFHAKLAALLFQLGNALDEWSTGGPFHIF